MPRPSHSTVSRSTSERYDYYRLLGVEEDAGAEAIKRAYRACARACHPDRHPNDPIAAERFKGITEAYEVLSDPARRQQYDLLRRYPLNAFGRFPTASSFPQPSSAKPTNLRLRLSFEQALRGGKATVQLPGGRTARIAVPRGVPDGAILHLKSGAPKGPHLVVTFRVDPSERFRRDGLDLRATEKISVFDALLGTERTIEDAHGREVTLAIPPGTQPGDELRLTGHGVANAERAGDLVVTIEVEVPRDLSDEQRDRLRQAAEDAGLR